MRAPSSRVLFAANIVIAIAGDWMRHGPAAAEKLFRPHPRPPAARFARHGRAKAGGEKRVAVETPSQPFLAIAWKRPDQHE